MHVLSQKEAADFLRVPLSTFKMLAKEHDIPVAKLGRRCVYLADDLINFVRQMQTHTVAKPKRATRTSTSTPAYDVVMSHLNAEKELEVLLAPKTSSTQRGRRTSAKTNPDPGK